MTPFATSVTIGIVLLFTVAGCEQQGPPPKPIGAATNKHVEETPAAPSRQDAEAMMQKMKTPMEDARHTEDVLRGAADRREQSEQRTP
jgi:predicted small lipoprotein YifL